MHNCQSGLFQRNICLLFLLHAKQPPSFSPALVDLSFCNFWQSVTLTTVAIIWKGLVPSMPVRSFTRLVIHRAVGNNFEVGRPELWAKPTAPKGDLGACPLENFENLHCLRLILRQSGRYFKYWLKAAPASPTPTAL